MLQARVYGQVSFSGEAQQPASFDEPASASFRLREEEDEVTYEVRADCFAYPPFWAGAVLRAYIYTQADGMKLQTYTKFHVKVTGGRLTDADRVTAKLSTDQTEIIFTGGSCQVRVAIPPEVREALRAMQ